MRKDWWNCTIVFKDNAKEKHDVIFNARVQLLHIQIYLFVFILFLSEELSLSLVFYKPFIVRTTVFGVFRSYFEHLFINNITQDTIANVHISKSNVSSCTLHVTSNFIWPFFYYFNLISNFYILLRCIICFHKYFQTFY